MPPRRWAVLFVLPCYLLACTNAAPPRISALLGSFSPGASPTGYRSAAVVVRNGEIGELITDAAVTVNDVPLAYSSTYQDYEADVQVAPGTSVALEVSVGGNTYTASAQQLTSYPTVTAPESGSNWTAQCEFEVGWLGGAAAAEWTYLVWLLDAADPNSTLWATAGPWGVPIRTTSFVVPAGSFPVGEGLLAVGSFQEIPIAGADAESLFLVGGLDAVPIVVSSIANVTSLSIVYGPAELLKNSWERFDVAGTFCDGTTRGNLGEQASWSSSNPSVAVVSNAPYEWGKVTALATGSSTLTATLGGVSAFLDLRVRGTLQDAGVHDWLKGVAWSGSQLVAVGIDGVLTSPDGVTWTRQTAGVDTTDHFSGVVWSGSQFVAVGYQGAVLTSPDGVTWTRASGVPLNADFSGITWSGSQFAAVGSQDIYTSLDGETWTSHPMASNLGLASIAWAGTQFVAGAQLGTILTSPDGTTWTPHDAGTTNIVWGIAWSGTQLVAVGSGGAIRTSPDGVTWTSQATPTINQGWNGVTWDGSEFVAVGSEWVGGTILTSPDGVTWTNWSQQDALAATPLNGVTGSGGKFVAVGSGGTVVTSW